MEFQLPSVLQKKLTPYDEVRRKVEAEKKKAVRKASRPFHLGLPPLDLLIPNDVLPKNCEQRRADQKDQYQRVEVQISRSYLPRSRKGYEEEIRHQNGKPLTFKTDRQIGA